MVTGFSSVFFFFFHFGQANWRNVVSLGFMQRYIEDLDFALKAVRMVTAFAFMPADKIYKGFQEVSMIMPEDFQYFLKYFEKTYVGMPKVVSNPGETIRLCIESKVVYMFVSEKKAILTLKKIFLFIPFLGKALSVSVGECR